MDALLILGGLLLIVMGIFWLVGLAFGTSLFWGIGALFPPVTLIYLFRHWAVARKALLLGGLGFIPLVVGLSLLASNDPERLAAIISMQWLDEDATSEPRLSMGVRGQLNGRPFSPQKGEFIDGVVTLREGDDFFANQAVNIRLMQLVEGPLQVDVLPQDAAGQVPEIEISWMGPEQQLPEARRVSHGYTLHLNLQPVPPNKLAGDFHLVLPPRYQTNISGTVELYTDGLRYRGGEVDRHHDSQATLAHVAHDYLQRLHGTRKVQVESVSAVRFPATALVASVHARVNGEEQHLELRLHKGQQGWSVEGDDYPSLPAEPVIQGAEALASQERIETPAPAPAPRIDRRQRFSMERLLREPSRYRNLMMRARTERGGLAEGRFVGIDQEGNLSIQRILEGPGEALYNLAPKEIANLELLEP